jgi:hypothetical protein
VPEGRRLGHVNVVCVVVIACVGAKEGKKRGNGDWVRNLKVGQLTLSHGASKGRGSQPHTRDTIPSKRFIYTLNIHKVPHLQ